MSNKIFIQNGCYCKNTKVGDIELATPITNFTMEIISNHYRDEGIFREIVFIKDGQRSRPILINPDDMWTNFQNYLSFCGEYLWRGNKNDLTNLWELLFSKSSGKTVLEPEFVGLQDDGSFLFENIAIKKDKVITPDDNGTFWTGNEGIKPRSISASRSEASEGIPYLVTNKDLDFELLRDKLSTSMNPSKALQCLSWCASVLYMEEVFAKYGAFPFLFITGKRRSGKSTIAEWLTNLFGFESAGRMWSDTTPVGMSRLLAYYSGLPLWLDEYRNDTKYATKIGMLRNVYNRQSSGKGTKDGFTVREAKIRGTCIITGEETPTDNALMSRCIVVEVTEKERNSSISTHSSSTNVYNWFTDNRRLLSNFTYKILRNKHLLAQDYLVKLSEYKDDLATVVDDRAAINSAVLAAGHFILFGEDKNFLNSLLQKTTTDKDTLEEESIVNVFFDDVAAMMFSGAVSSNYLVERDGFVYIYFQGLYNEWAIDYKKRRGEPPFKLQSLRSYLTQEQGFVSNSVSCRFGEGSETSVRSCVKFNKEELPSYIKQLLK